MINKLMSHRKNGENIIYILQANNMMAFFVEKLIVKKVGSSIFMKHISDNFHNTLN